MLEHLHKTISTCIDYHKDRNSTTKVNQLEEKLAKVKETMLDSTTTTPDLYHDESKK